MLNREGNATLALRGVLTKCVIIVSAVIASFTLIPGGATSAGAATPSTVGEVGYHAYGCRFGQGKQVAYACGITIAHSGGIVYAPAYAFNSYSCFVQVTEPNGRVVDDPKWMCSAAYGFSVFGWTPGHWTATLFASYTPGAPNNSFRPVLSVSGNF